MLNAGLNVPLWSIHSLSITLRYFRLFLLKMKNIPGGKGKESNVSLIITKTLFNSIKLGLLGDYIRNEESIDSTRNRISPLKVFHSLLYRRSSVLQDIYFLYQIWRFVSVCVNKYTKIKASMWEKLHNCQRTKRWWSWHVISIIAENEPQAYHKTQFTYSESWPHPTS